MQGALKAAVNGILNWQYILQVHCIDGNTYRLPFAWQCKVYCMYSIYCSYTVLLAVDLQYILHPTASILHFGLGCYFMLMFWTVPYKIQNPMPTQCL